jgi:hypothetical protein
MDSHAASAQMAPSTIRRRSMIRKTRCTMRRSISQHPTEILRNTPSCSG